MSEVNGTRCGHVCMPFREPHWLTDVLERMVSGRTKANELARLLPWTWKVARLAAAVLS